jgi:hypothetical protein
LTPRAENGIRYELKSIHWDTVKLLELGVSEDFIRQLNSHEARELLKGLLYLLERYSDDVSASK